MQLCYGKKLLRLKAKNITANVVINGIITILNTMEKKDGIVTLFHPFFWFKQRNTSSISFINIF